jgi:methylated-DNA-[protein]-cysteine S-methyltransferase
MKAGIDSPIGPLTLVAKGDAIVALDWAIGPPASGGVLGEAVAELEAYFAGTLRAFNVPMAPRGSVFQLEFYAALCAIPYGQTRTYGDLAAQLGVSAQAIGQACGANPLAILVPCHRVLAANGLGGYSGAGGVEAKVTLLRLEGGAGLLI